MRWVNFTIWTGFAVGASAQVPSYPPFDISGLMPRSEAVASIATINSAITAETNARVAAVSAIPPLPDLSPYATASGLTALSGQAVKTVNGTAPVSGNVTIAIPSIAGLATTASVTAATANMVTSVAGIAPTGGNVPLTIASVGNVSGVAYFHRYPGIVLTVPAIAIGGTGTGTATVVGTVAGDQCFVAPTAATTALSYIMGSGWVTTAGTVKVALAAPSVVAISAGTVTVNMLCAQ